MPSPIGHSLMGLVLLILRRRIGRWRELLSYWKEGIGFVLLANMPDVDFFNPELRKFDLLSPHHHGAIHTFSFAFLIATAVLLFRQRKVQRWEFGLWGWSFTAVSSHLLLDLFFSNVTEPPGMAIFWPFYDQRIILPVHWYYYWERSDIVSMANLIPVAGEFLVGGFLVASLLFAFSQKPSNRERL